MKIFIVGVFHNFQTERSEEFIEYLRHTCSSLSIKSIGEEMSRDGLADAKITRSIVQTIADDIGLPHQYCDPGQTERDARGILGENDLEAKKSIHCWSDEEFERQRALHFRKREERWIEKLQPAFVDPMLFVCGIAHLDTFSTMNYRRSTGSSVMNPGSHCVQGLKRLGPPRAQ